MSADRALRRLACETNSASAFAPWRNNIVDVSSESQAPIYTPIPMPLVFMSESPARLVRTRRMGFELCVSDSNPIV
jgi:hypothetical protein